MFFYLTNILLDVSFGALWWVTKNTTVVLYNGLYYIKNSVDSKLENTEDEAEKDTIKMDYIIMDCDDYEKLKNLKNEINTLKSID